MDSSYFLWLPRWGYPASKLPEVPVATDSSKFLWLPGWGYPAWKLPEVVVPMDSYVMGQNQVQDPSQLLMLSQNSCLGLMPVQLREKCVGSESGTTFHSQDFPDASSRQPAAASCSKQCLQPAQPGPPRQAARPTEQSQPSQAKPGQPARARFTYGPPRPTGVGD